MNNTKRIIIAIIAVVVVAGGAIWYMTATSNKTAAPNDTQGQDNNASETIAATITYDGDAFNSSTDKVASGSTVKVTNNSDKELEFSSDPHPVHTDNPELNEGMIAPRESKTFILNTKGVWGFHNHLDATQHGSITVE